MNVVEALRQIACQFQMLFLVGAHGHEVSLVKQDVRRHQHGIIEQSGIYVVGMARALFLELRHSLQLALISITVEHPAQLRMFGHMALHVKDAFFWIDAAGK